MILTSVLGCVAGVLRHTGESGCVGVVGVYLYPHPNHHTHEVTPQVELCVCGSPESTTPQ